MPVVCSYHTDPVHCFDDKTKKPCTGLCGHTVCLECITVHNCSRCPVCGLKGAFSNVSVNYASIALIEDCRNKFWEKWRGWMDKKKPVSGFYSKLIEEAQLLCSICVDPVKIPRICLTCDKETLFKLNRWQWKQYNAVVSKLLQRVMCSNCALDNHEEKGHTIVKQEMNKNSKKDVSMAIAQTILNMFKDAIENKKGAIDCLLRQLKIEMIGQNLMKTFGELEYIEEGKCGYLGELIKQKLIKKYIENVDEKMLDLFSTEGNAICDCSKLRKKLVENLPPSYIDMVIRENATKKPYVFATGCPLYSWNKMADLCRHFSISVKAFSKFEAKTLLNDINCPLCVYNDYSQHQKKNFLLKSGMGIIQEILKSEMTPLDTCCLRCLDSLNDCQFLLSCENQKESRLSSEMFSNWYREKKLSGKKESCYQNCFMRNTSTWNFVTINHMMAKNNLYEVIMYEIEQTDGLVDCQLQKIRMKETVGELFEGLNTVRFWEYFDHLSKPLEMNTLLKSFKQQWNSFRFGKGEQKTASQCKCTVIWNKHQENILGKEKCKDLEAIMIDMTRYSMTEEIHGCPTEYNHGIEFNKDIIRELEDAFCFESIDEKRGLTSVGDENMNCLMRKIDNKAYLPYTGKCGHTICLVCIEKTSNGDCPVCGKEGSFERSKLNEDLLQEIKSIRENAWEIFKKLWNNEAADSGKCSRCNKSSSDLYICPDDNVTIVYARSIRLRMDTTADVLKLSRHALCQECASAQAHATKKMNSIPFWKQYLKKTNGIFLLELLEEQITGGKNCDCELLRTEIQKNRRKLVNVLGELNHVEREDCGYDRELIELKLIEKLIQNIDQNMKKLFMSDENLFEPIKERSCTMCVMIDYLDCAKIKSEQNRNEWMNIFEQLWSTQSLRFEKCCIRCLLYLNDRYSASCQTKAEFANIKKMGNAISEGIEKGQLKNFQYVLTLMHCKDCNRRVDDKEIWQNLMIRECFFCLLQTMTKGLSKTTFPCYLRKIRIHNLAYHFLSEVCDVWLMNNQFWILGWMFIKASNMVKSLNHQFKKLKREMDKEEFEIKCECTEIWERNQKMIKKIGHEDCEEKRKCQELEDSMEEMARFSLEEDLDGCPMEYNHGIELDEESVRKLKETADLEEEAEKNKCLCVQIDSLGPNTAIFGASLNQTMPFVINWWKYEASYPHLLCHECIDRLELIQNRLETLPGFHNCELRRMRMLKTFAKLTRSIQRFQISKGRVFKSDMEKMTKVFVNFISQWDLYQSGSEYDQQSSTAEMVCHCTNTLNKSRSLQNENTSWEEREEHAYLMDVANMLSELNLTEIISGCPLDFDHNLDVDCFNRERWDKLTDISDCSQAS